ncbi:MAG: hypothetical protein ACI4BH_04875 [Muribaculaceae bacterium]
MVSTTQRERERPVWCATNHQQISFGDADSHPLSSPHSHPPDAFPYWTTGYRGLRPSGYTPGYAPQLRFGIASFRSPTLPI